jgi:predicted RNA-binding Zn ribbon-like protein
MATSVSGHLALEFANTIDNYRLAEPYDFIPNYASLVDFCVRVGTLSRAEAQPLLQAAEADPTSVAEFMGRTRSLRSVIYRLFSSLAQGRTAPEQELETLNRHLMETSAHARIQQEANGFRWGWIHSPAEHERLLWPLVAAAADLLTSPDLTRLRQCEGHNCTWMFLDQSKNHSRRWCSMEICGNRAKSQRHYARRRTS